MNKFVKSAMIIIAFTGLTDLSTSIKPVNAAAKAKVVSTRKVSKKPYTVSNGYFYSSAKLTKKIHNQHNYLQTTFYSYKSATVKKQNGNRAVYYYVKNKSGSVKGWVWRGSLVKPKTYTQEKSDMNNVVAILKGMSDNVQNYNTLAQFRHMDYKHPYGSDGSNGGRCIANVISNVAGAMVDKDNDDATYNFDVQGALKLYQLFKGRFDRQDNQELAGDFDNVDDAMHGDTSNGNLSTSVLNLLQDLAVNVESL